jgi:hypothetical protein
MTISAVAGTLRDYRGSHQQPAPPAATVVTPEKPFGQVAPFGQVDYDPVNNITVINAEAKVVIEGPDTIKVGELGRLTTEKSKGRTFKWSVLPGEGIDFEVYNDGRKVVFSSNTPGEYIFIVACAFENDVDIAMHKVVIEAGEATIKPPPVPPTVGQVAKFIELIGLVQSSNKQEEAKKLADAFQSVVHRINAGELTDADLILEATATANNEAIGNNIVKWIPFLDSLKLELERQADAGLLVTKDQHVAVWKDIIEALLAVAKE